MNRIELINHFIKKYSKKHYLEIGVETGACFLNIKARYKTGVDPRIIIPNEFKSEMKWKNFNFLIKLKHQTSNDFFASNKQLFDIILIDGLHTYQQSLTDAENALKFLAPDGLIVMHDCKPVSEAAAQFANSHQDAINKGIVPLNGEWNGDVYKTILHLRSRYYSFANQIDVKVLDCDYGLGIIKKGVPNELIDISLDSIAKMNYSEFLINQSEFLNLVSVSSFSDF